jgi:hypothetical protein
MQAPGSANPPFSLALSSRLPPYKHSHMRRYHPYPRSGSRVLEFDDPPTMVSAFYDAVASYWHLNARIVSR